MEPTLALEKNLLHLYALCSACTAPQLRDFLESRVLCEQVKRIKKMGDTSLPLQAGSPPMLGWAGLPLRGSPSSRTRSLWSPEDFEGPLCIPRGPAPA